MAEQFFHVMKRHPAFCPSRSGFVTQVVKVQVDFSHPSPARFGEAAFRPLGVTPGGFEERHVPRVLERGHGSANFVAEHEGIDRQLVAIRIESRECQDSRQARRNRHEAILRVLGRFSPHPEFAAAEINVLPSQRQQFPEPAAGLERSHDQSIDPGRRGTQQPRFFVGREAATPPRLRLTGKFRFREGISLEVAFAHGPAEHHSQQLAVVVVGRAGASCGLQLLKERLEVVGRDDRERFVAEVVERGDRLQHVLVVFGRFFAARPGVPLDEEFTERGESQRRLLR